MTARRTATLLLALLLGPAMALGSDEPVPLPALIAAAEAGDVAAQAAVADRYWFGDGVTADPPAAVRWYRRAAEQGDAGACYWLGTAYEQGIGVAADPAAAALWFRQGADAGEAYSQNALGMLYKEGRGVPQSDVEAVRWFRAAADQGIAAGQHSLGTMYGAGRGVDKDPVKAVSLWEQAASQGFTVAWYDLGGAYQKGWGVPNADAVCAYAFFSVAADDGLALAASLRGHLAAKLTADELAEGRRLAREAKERVAGGGLLTHCPSQPVILTFDAIDVQELLGVFAALTGLEIKGAEGLTGTVTLDAEYPDWRAALSAALQQVGRRWERRGEGIHVLPATPAP